MCCRTAFISCEWITTLVVFGLLCISHPGYSQLRATVWGVFWLHLSPPETFCCVNSLVHFGLWPACDRLQRIQILPLSLFNFKAEQIDCVVLCCSSPPMGNGSLIQFLWFMAAWAAWCMGDRVAHISSAGYLSCAPVLRTFMGWMCVFSAKRKTCKPWYLCALCINYATAVIKSTNWNFKR